jgi:hypothetical protein
MSGERRTTEESFHSARENATIHNLTVETSKATTTIASGVSDILARFPTPKRQPSPLRAVQNETPDLDIDMEAEQPDDAQSPIDALSPAKTLVRKSSLTFASLPAREPLATKKSIGARNSTTNPSDPSRTSVLGRGSYLGKYTAGTTNVYEDEKDDDLGRPFSRDESDAEQKISKLHSKSSTQRLHERINMLGKTQAPRPTKSIPSAMAIAQPTYPDLAQKDAANETTKWAETTKTTKVPVSRELGDEDDDWIQPPSKSEQATRTESFAPRALPKLPAAKYNTRLSSGKFQDDEEAHCTLPTKSTIAVTAGNKFSHPDADANWTSHESTTPIGSPVTRAPLDGHLSASKSKLQSIMKSARGLFASSANIGSQAQHDFPTTTPRILENPAGHTRHVANPVGPKSVIYPPLPAESHQSPAQGRKTRSSTEKEERQKELLAQNKDQDHIHAKEVKSHDVRGAVEEIQAQGSMDVNPQSTRKSPRRHENEQLAETTTVDPLSMVPPSRPHPNSSFVQKQKETRRPIRPAKEQMPKAKPQPVAIRLGALSSQRIPLTNAALASGLQDSLAPPPAKAQTITKKPSNASLTSTNSFTKSTAAPSKPKALIAAERKKELEEREAQRKLEHKREIERKRAAAQEETQRRELAQRQEAEKQQERERQAAAEKAKHLAQRQAMEKRRLEQAKRDQQAKATAEAVSWHDHVIDDFVLRQRS